jgi:signal transduction histidine kinase
VTPAAEGRGEGATAEGRGEMAPAKGRGETRSADGSPEPAPSLRRPAQRGWWLATGLVLVASLLLWAAQLARQPWVDAAASAGRQGELLVQLSPARGGGAALHVVALRTTDGVDRPLDARLLHRAPRWVVNDVDRQAAVAHNAALMRAAAGGSVVLVPADGEAIALPAAARGWQGLGWLFWPINLAAILVLLSGLRLLAAPGAGPLAVRVLYALMCAAQAGNLVFVAASALPGLGLPAAGLVAEFPARLLFDALTVGAGLHALALHPRVLANARVLAAAAWGGAACMASAALLLPGAWWWAQGLGAALALAGGAIGRASERNHRHPLAPLLRRLLISLLVIWLVVSLAVAVAAQIPNAAAGTAVTASALWGLFFAALLVLTPYLARSRALLRELTLLAGVSTVATSLDLLLAAVFSLGPFASLTLAVFLALGVYAGLRQWLLGKLVGAAPLATDRILGQLYRVAREVRAKPERYPSRTAQLLRELFDPVEVAPMAERLARSRVLEAGAALAVPVGRLEQDSESERSTLSLRFAQQGRRLFTVEDARLADQLVAQLRSALAQEAAIERGRHEERLRIAQDLHDDIGARLLTLMYQAQTPEMEQYIRHTLQDLKTLTRGLAATEHRFSHALAEWKADITQRLEVAGVQSAWHHEADDDPQLGVVQWSGLTRVLRELVSNVLQHAAATRVELTITLARGRLTLRVSDDGVGRQPESWSHGLGLGGVRKRVKLLGGQVQWNENTGSGITCVVELPDFGPAE